MVIGGMALNFHKILRNTIDTDIWVEPSVENFCKLSRILEKMGYEPAEFQFLNEHVLQETLIFGIEGPIDFLSSVHKEFDFQDCFTRSLSMSIGEVKIPILSLLDLRELKIRAKRPQDLRDVGLIDDFLKES